MKNRGRITRSVLLVLAFALVASSCASGDNQENGDAVVRAILFYSPSCHHCHDVMDNHLPPLEKAYGKQLDILEVDVATTSGSALHQAAMVHLQIQSRGVPKMIVGDQVLLGSQEIPQKLPDLIEQGLASGGVDWPDIPGFVPPES